MQNHRFARVLPVYSSKSLDLTGHLLMMLFQSFPRVLVRQILLGNLGFISETRVRNQPANYVQLEFAIKLMMPEGSQWK